MAWDDDPRDVLDYNQEQAQTMVAKLGEKRTEQLLRSAHADVMDRILAIKPGARDGFTETQLRATKAQLDEALKTVTGGLKDILLDATGKISEKATRGTIDYLVAADRKFRGVGKQPLALNEAMMFERSEQGARSSLLHRLASSGMSDVKNADKTEHKAKKGVLERYSDATIQSFEEILQRGLITKKSWSEMSVEIQKSSPFLKGKPANWANRIVRTESMGVYNRAAFEANREADEQLEDVIKILSSTFDDRTGSDSYAVHGQCRRPDQAFDSWYGLFQHPPDRANDRGIVVPHRISWNFPKYLLPRSNAEVRQRWSVHERRKGNPPARPKMTTVEIPGVVFPH